MVKDLSFRALMGMTLSSQTDVDLSRPAYNHSDRSFWGLELRYKGIDPHDIFAYILWQEDHNDEFPTDPLQDYEFDSKYVGLGSEGTLFLSNLRYLGEFVWECGKRYANGATDEGAENINAYALDGQLEYLFDHPLDPRVQAEYLLASGDSDRIASPTNTVGGNRRNTRDTSFVGFGFRDTGISFAPEISNIQMVRMGGSLFPLKMYKVFKELELGLNWFIYHKDRSEGAVSDPTATQPIGRLGHEMDVFANWRITSDISWLVRWGVFWPAGGAFADDQERHYLLSAMTFSF
jgi:hypothetical protein